MRLITKQDIITFYMVKGVSVIIKNPEAGVVHIYYPDFQYDKFNRAYNDEMKHYVPLGIHFRTICVGTFKWYWMKLVQWAEEFGK